MPKPINMPKLSDEMTEGKIADWLKSEGDEVKAGDIVAQVETEKATLDVEAFESGVLLAIVVGKGTTAPVGSPIAWIGKQGEKVPDAPAPSADDAGTDRKSGGEVSHPSTQPVAPAQRAAEAGHGGGVSAAGAGAPAPAPARPPPPPAAATPSPPAAPARTPAQGRIIASPAARKAARERGLELGAMAGSGPGGRIVLADLDRAPPAR